ncbi:DNA-directed RNA polymerase subunit delta [Bacillus coahuilensis]|uniref:DNA-directed RNA polymerase subunit delta n=1 Tax=Bacillus coahuilensis TaxID=408580 RepID=UPI00018512B2|nr:DNA-directed RNA polymerase subunit delta [Bacillus coahuilensis]
MNIRELSQDELKEVSFIEITNAILLEKKEAIPFNEIVKDIQKILEISDQEMKRKIAQFYTDMNIDGRFLAIGDNKWGLREWYPVDQIEEETAPTIKVRKKKKKSEDDEDLFDDIDEEELDLDELDDFEEDEDLAEDEDLEDFDDTDDEEIIEDDDDLEIVEDDEEEEEEEEDEEEEF